MDRELADFAQAMERIEDPEAVNAVQPWLRRQWRRPEPMRTQRSSPWRILTLCVGMALLCLVEAVVYTLRCHPTALEACGFTLLMVFLAVAWMAVSPLRIRIVRVDREEMTDAN